MNQEYVKVTIKKRFTDGRNQLWSPGVVEVDKRTAQRLLASGRAVLVKEPDAAGEEPQKENQPPPPEIKVTKGYVKKADRQPPEDIDESQARTGSQPEN